MIRYAGQFDLLSTCVICVFGYHIARYTDADREHSDLTGTENGFLDMEKKTVYLNTDRDRETQCKTLIEALMRIMAKKSNDIGLVSSVYWLLDQIDHPARIDSVKDL